MYLVLPQGITHLVFETGPLPGLKLTKSLTSELWGPAYLHLPRTLELQAYTMHGYFFCSKSGLWGLNLCSYACKANTLLTELSIQLPLKSSF